MNQDQQQQLGFEHWLRCKWTAGYACVRKDDGYTDKQVQFLWECWKDSSALTATQQAAHSKQTYAPCKGMNCGATNGVSHSLECEAEHSAAIAGGTFVKAAPSQGAGEVAELIQHLYDESQDNPDDYRWKAAALLQESTQREQPAADDKAGGYAKALEIRTAQGWKLSGEAIPVLYTDEINGQQVCRDDVWLCTTSALRKEDEKAGGEVFADDLIRAINTHRNERHGEMDRLLRDMKDGAELKVAYGDFETLAQIYTRPQPQADYNRGWNDGYKHGAWASKPQGDQPAEQREQGQAWAVRTVGGKKWLAIHASKSASDKWLEFKRKEQARSEIYEQIALKEIGVIMESQTISRGDFTGEQLRAAYHPTPPAGVPDGFPCEIEEADFEQNTITLKMLTTDYRIHAGEYRLSAAPQPEDIPAIFKEQASLTAITVTTTAIKDETVLKLNI